MVKLVALALLLVVALLTADGRYSGGPSNLAHTPPVPRCAAGSPHTYTWFATVQHCMWISKNHTDPPGNNCPLLNDTLFGLVRACALERTSTRCIVDYTHAPRAVVRA